MECVWFTDAIASIPDVIWSGIIASALTFTGVLLSNASNTKRLKIQLNHDSNEKQKERTATLRRETYLSAAEHMSKAMGHLGSLPQQKFDGTPATELSDLLATSSKLQLIAEPTTALKVGELTGAYTELHLKLMGKAFPMQMSRIDIDISNQFYESSSTEAKRLQSEISRLIESNAATEDNLRPLQNAYNFHSEQAQNYAEERNAAWNKYNAQQFEYCRTLYIEMEDVLEKQNNVTIAIRQDLGLNSHLSDFQLQMAQQSKKIKDSLNVLLATMEENLREEKPEA
ncbi:hypothetical protein [Pseudomonas sp. ABFPK]|uniref:hypothetical protein n=1 Tax=Pseudomonas sp. ABFPK TaxID=1636605 RepID=UPI0007789EF6|nr:hypothetical protein [Pseudomonas sp. ABFPK]KYC24037.1 hypothetical protein WM94_10820 [Pseudomonas sp. ABFPK]